MTEKKPKDAPGPDADAVPASGANTPAATAEGSPVDGSATADTSAEVSDSGAGNQADQVTVGTKATEAPSPTDTHGRAVADDQDPDLPLVTKPVLPEARPYPEAAVGNEVQAGNVYPQSYESALNEANEILRQAEAAESQAAALRADGEARMDYANSLRPAPTTDEGE